MNVTRTSNRCPLKRIGQIMLVVSIFAAMLAGCADGDGNADGGGGGALVIDGDGDGDETATCYSAVSETESAPRLWVEAALNAIRRDFPAPTVHARNLWHLSAVMWDAYAVFMPGLRPYFDTSGQEVSEKPNDPEADATIALSFAAHRLLTARYEAAVGGAASLREFDAVMTSLCLDPANTGGPGSPATIGIAIAEQALMFGASDGALEADGYVDDSYMPVNSPLVVASDVIEMHDANRWQPLELPGRITQNGQAEAGTVQPFIGSHWGSVASFALPPADEEGITIDPGPPPYLGTDSGQAFVDAAVQVIGYSDLLGGDSGAELVEIGPSARGNIPLGQSVGVGHPTNPVTLEPYERNEVPHSDYGRAIAEFWADGPDSETPPGHWNTLAIAVSDLLPPSDLRWANEGDPLSRLEWDLRLFFTLNASLHDTAIAVWGAKRAYDYPRPISIVRYLGAGNGGGLPLTPGLVEVVTDESGADGNRHQGLEVGARVVRTWMGQVTDPESQLAGVGWQPAIDWLPYQRSTFVSPAFAAYVSGHSGFSRAAADVLTQATGSEYFPGGMFTHTVPAGSLLHEKGPSVEITLQWATYQDAADEAGESRRYGGIHVEADDIAGRIMGAEIAELTWDQAQNYFG